MKLVEIGARRLLGRSSATANAPQRCATFTNIRIDHFRYVCLNLYKYDYAPQMIVPEFTNYGPSLWHVLATQISAAQTPS